MWPRKQQAIAWCKDWWLWRLPDDYQVPENAEATPTDEYGDNYEDVLKQDEKVDLKNFDTVLKAIETVKNIGTEQFKKQNYSVALEKYVKCDKFLKEYFPEDLEKEQIENQSIESVYSIEYCHLCS